MTLLCSLPLRGGADRAHAAAHVAHAALCCSTRTCSVADASPVARCAALRFTVVHRLSDSSPLAACSEHVNLVFIGHVDAGKSTIGGQILFLTGSVDERLIAKYEREAKEKNRESWYMAYIMDTNEEERAKGKTVEVGRAHFETAKKRYTILDAPGHKNYVPNMIAGAAQADVGVLVISSRKGEFETGFERGGQTREHAQLAKTLGVAKLVVVVNKMDDPSVMWDAARFEEVQTKLSPFLKQCGYNTKKDVHFLPISGLYGQRHEGDDASGLRPGGTRSLRRFLHGVPRDRHSRW